MRETTVRGRPDIRLDGVGRRYGVRGPWVLREVSLALPPGALVRFEGANGAGKSTLLRIVAGVDRPTAGRVTGRPAASTAYVPERFPAALPFPVLRYLTRLGEVRGLSAAAARARAEHWLERFAIGGYAGTPLDELSKGTCQKVAVAQALLADPRLLVLDEAWTGLDHDARAVLDDAVRERVASGTTVVFVDHDPHRLADEPTTLHRLTAAGAVTKAPSAPHFPPPSSGTTTPSAGGSPGPAGLFGATEAVGSAESSQGGPSAADAPASGAAAPFGDAEVAGAAEPSLTGAGVTGVPAPGPAGHLDAVELPPVGLSADNVAAPGSPPTGFGVTGVSADGGSAPGPEGSFGGAEVAGAADPLPTGAGVTGVSADGVPAPGPAGHLDAVELPPVGLSADNVAAPGSPPSVSGATGPSADGAPVPGPAGHLGATDTVELPSGGGVVKPGPGGPYVVIEADGAGGLAGVPYAYTRPAVGTVRVTVPAAESDAALRALLDADPPWHITAVRPQAAASRPRPAVPAPAAPAVTEHGRRTTAALLRYQADLLVRSHRWLPPILFYGSVMAIGVAAGEPLLGSLGYAAALLLPMAAWMVRVCVTNEPPAARACVASAVGAGRAQLGALVTALLASALVGAVGTGLVVAISGAHSDDMRTAVPVGAAAVAGLLAAAVSVLVGTAVGTLANPPLLRGSGWSVLGTALAAGAVLVASGSPAHAAVTDLVTGSRTGSVPYPILPLAFAAPLAALTTYLSCRLISRLPPN